MRLAWLAVLIVPLSASAETPRLTLEGGLPSGTASELRPLAYSPTLSVFLVERSDKRPSGNERSWNFYSRSLELVGYATLTTDSGISEEHVQWLGDAASPAKSALAELATLAREKLRLEPRKLDKLWGDWEKLRPVACPVRVVKHDSSVDLVTSKELLVATVETPLAPADSARGCSAPAPTPIRCMGAADGDVAVVMAFKQSCNVSHQVLVAYNPRNVEFLKEAQAGAAALAKGDLAGAREHLDASLKLEPKHAPAHFFRACLSSRSGVPFKDGRAELEQILGSEEERQLWLPKIKSDPNLNNWRIDPDFAHWFAQFPTRTPIR